MVNDNLICGAIGFVTGCMVGGFAIGNLCRKRHLKIVKELRDSGASSKSVEEAESKEDPEDAEDDDISDDEIDFDDPFGDEIVDEKPEDMELETYAALSKKYHSSAFDEHFADRAHPDEENADPNDIRIISRNIFEEDIDIRDTETIYYYQKDGVLADVLGRVIDNPLGTIGFEAMEKLDDTEDDIIYISNDIEDKMYEVIVEHDETLYKDMAEATIV